MSTDNWEKVASIEKLRQIRIAYPANVTQHRVADEEIRLREAEESIRQAERAAKLESERYQKLVDLQADLKNSIDRLAKPHSLLWWTFAVALLTLIVCVIGYWDQIIRLFRALGL